MRSADTATIPLTLIQDGERVMRICNACRYCEGFCAVFPAIERRLVFAEADLLYLANLCHNCGECLYSCQYAPPHEFAVNVPRLMSTIRQETFHKYAWPGIFAGLFRRNGLLLLAGTVLIPALWLLAVIALAEPGVLTTAHSDQDGAFYRVVPYRVMAGLFGAIAIAICVPFIVGLLRFWRDVGGQPAALIDRRAIARAFSDACTLRYLDGDGHGCAYPGEVPSRIRQRYHHFTFYGFLLCGAATTAAAFYHHVLGWEAPYPLASVPVVLGMAGGAGLLIGPAGLLWIRMSRNPEMNNPNEAGMDVGFLVLLLLTSISGFLLLAGRESTAMGPWLILHLGWVAGLFLTLPYGKFVHGIYRSLALLRNAIESQPR
ncbi:MAG: tricarballylate utilization 4Fe-4S protein TcuB [Acidobacteriota bacterium]